MRSLAFKLTLAFLLIGITGAALVSIIFTMRTRSAFNQFVSDTDKHALIEYLEEYYQTVGSWSGVNTYLVSMVGPSPDHEEREMPGSGNFTLMDEKQVVLYGAPEQVGKPAPADELVGAVPLDVNSQTVGWVEFESGPPSKVPHSPEVTFLSSVNEATGLSALVIVALALLAGGFLSYTMTRSLRELTDATRHLARGKLGMQVKVRSKDELGALAESFNTMSLELSQATQARQQMTADIAHDLRSPLSVISGYAEGLSEGKLPGTPETYEIMFQETQHLSRLVDDLRTLSLVDAGELSLKLEPIDPNTLLERVAARYRMAAQQKGIHLEIEPYQGQSTVMIDLARMVQVLDNLVLNAFRYTPSGGVVTLSARSVQPPGKHGHASIFEQQVQIQVRDTGKGIAPEDLPHIFDRFYRVDKARNSSTESGLGLAIAKSIVEAQGGEIEVESLLGEGTTFTISLPSG